MRQGQPLVLWNYATWYQEMPSCWVKMKSRWMILGDLVHLLGDLLLWKYVFLFTNYFIQVITQSSKTKTARHKVNQGLPWASSWAVDGCRQYHLTVVEMPTSSNQMSDDILRLRWLADGAFAMMCQWRTKMRWIALSCGSSARRCQSINCNEVPIKQLRWYHDEITMRCRSSNGK